MASSRTKQVRSTVLLRIPNADGADPDSRVLGEFMMLLRAIYVAAQEVGDGGAALDAYLARLSASDLSALLNTDKPPVPLLTRRISHQSPLEFLFFGLAYALVAGILRSGGKITVRGGLKAPGIDAAGEITAELPSRLSEANDKLRDVLSQGSGAPITYGPSARTVTLTKTQLAELMKHDPADERVGTFQRRLIGWQTRVKKNTRQLTLYPDDIDFILRHGSQAKKGGWQNSIRKIFSSHFDWKKS